MTEQMKSIRENLNAPSELVEAVAKGEPYRRSERTGDSKRRHVKRFSVAIAVYVCMAVLLVATVTLLPTLFEKSPTPAGSETTASTTHGDVTTIHGGEEPIPSVDPLTPEALYQKWLTADGVIVRVTNLLNESESVETYTFSGELVMCENDDMAPAYCDFEQKKLYSKLPGDENWIVSDANDADRNEFALNVVLLGLPWFFENSDYKQTDGKYVFTDRAVRALTDEFEQTGYYESVILMVGDPYTIEVTMEATDEGGRVSYVTSGAEGSMSTEIDVRFVDTTVTLPTETKPYEPDPVTPDALYEALNSGSDVTVNAERMLIQNVKVTERTAVYERDGNRVRLTERENLAESVRYIDMATGLEYYTPDEGGWLAKGSGHTYFDAVMDDYIFGIEPSFLFDSNNYEGSDGEYTLTDEASAELSAKLSGYAAIIDLFGDSVEVSTVIVHYGDGVTESWQVEKYVLSKDGSVSESTVYTITFGDTSVELPDERAGEPDTNRLLSPSQFGDLLYGDRDMTVTFDSGIRITLERDGGKVKRTARTHTGEYITYFDFDAGEMYTQTDGEWEMTKIVSDWQGLVDAGIFGEVWEQFSLFGCYIEVMFTDVNFTLEDGRYAAKEAFKRQCIEEGKAHCEFWYDEDPTYEIAFTYENGVHEFTYRFYTADGELVNEMTLTLTFGDCTVDLPA